MASLVCSGPSIVSPLANWISVQPLTSCGPACRSVVVLVAVGDPRRVVAAYSMRVQVFLVRVVDVLQEAVGREPRASSVRVTPLLVPVDRSTTALEATVSPTSSAPGTGSRTGAGRTRDAAARRRRTPGCSGRRCCWRSSCRRRSAARCSRRSRPGRLPCGLGVLVGPVRLHVLQRQGQRGQREQVRTIIPPITPTRAKPPSPSVRRRSCGRSHHQLPAWLSCSMTLTSDTWSWSRVPWTAGFLGRSRPA